MIAGLSPNVVPEPAVAFTSIGLLPNLPLDKAPLLKVDIPVVLIVKFALF